MFGKFFQSTFFSDDVPLVGRNLNFVYIFGSSASFLIAVIRFIQGYSILSVLVSLGASLVAIILFLLTHKFRIYKLSSIIAVTLICHILMPLLFFFNGGLNGGMAGFFVMTIVLICLVLKGVWCVIHVIINIAIIIACYLIGWNYPESVVSFSSDYYQVIDSLQTIFISGLLIGLLIRNNVKLYESEKKKAESATKAKGDFLASVSHEIRTPLNAIIGLGEIELRKELPKETYDNLEKIHQSGVILLNIINDLLDISKIEAGHFTLNPAPYQLPNLIQDTISLNLVRIGSKPIIFKLRVDENIPAGLYGDELRIRQILNNLLSNAFKYTKEGRIDLEIKHEINPAKQNEMILICSVEDTGIGIKDEDIAKLSHLSKTA